MKIIRVRSVLLLSACTMIGSINAMTETSSAPQEGTELIGTAAPAWEAVEWINSKPLTLDQLRGKVVLVRWWTGPECPYCAASAPNLTAWHQKYSQQGLVVIGFYHHKSPTPLSLAHVKGLMEQYHLTFPIAIDPGWQTLKRWWLDGHDRQWTSVSFLIDRDGMIRYIHPGGSYSETEANAIEALILQLLNAPQPKALPSIHPGSS